MQDWLTAMTLLRDAPAPVAARWTPLWPEDLQPTVRRPTARLRGDVAWPRTDRAGRHRRRVLQVHEPPTGCCWRWPSRRCWRSDRRSLVVVHADGTLQNVRSRHRRFGASRLSRPVARRHAIKPHRKADAHRRQQPLQPQRLDEEHDRRAERQRHQHDSGDLGPVRNAAVTPPFEDDRAERPVRKQPLVEAARAPCVTGRCKQHERAWSAAAAGRCPAARARARRCRRRERRLAPREIDVRRARCRFRGTSMRVLLGNAGRAVYRAAARGTRSGARRAAGGWRDTRARGRSRKCRRPASPRAARGRS